MAKKLLIAVVAVAGLLVALVVGAWLFLDANQFRPALETKMTETLGRRVTIGNLRIALWSGGIAADDLVIADDPAFSRKAFVTARSISVGVDLMPLLLSRSLRVESFRLDRPSVALLRSTSGTWNFSSLGGGATAPSSPPSASTAAASVLVQKISIAGGQIVVGGLDGRREPRSYDGVNLNVSDLSLTSQFPFTVTANAPNGGSLRVEGRAGPFNLKNMADTPFGGTVTVRHLDLASTGFVDAKSGLAGIVDFSGSLTSDGAAMHTKGKLNAVNVRVLPGSAASRVPIAVDYDFSYNSRSERGTLRQGDVHIGKALAHLTGSLDATGASPSVRMSLAAPGVPVSELEAALPAIGVTLPSGATLTQGTLDTTIAIAGPVDRLTMEGPVTLSKATLAGFDLGGKLGALAAFAGVPSTKDTVVETLGAALRLTPAGTAVDNLTLVVPSIGTLSGEGTITPAGAMEFTMLAKLRGGEIAAAPRAIGQVVSFAQSAGVPFRIQGTTSSPVFRPDAGRAARSVVNELKDAATNPDNLKKAADAIGDLFRKKQ